jgi:uncharacterized protein YbjT (DUF2867 family)
VGAGRVSAPAGNILLAGATGLVGGLALHRLLAPGFRGIVAAPTRRATGVADPRHVEIVCDLSADDAEARIAEALRAAGALPLDAFVCALGTTLRAAGSRAAFIAVDRDLVLRLARLAHAQGARHAVLVSSVGASRQSGNFYLRVKGEVEDAVERLGFARVDILQPGLLIGPRSARRPAEALAQRAAPLADLLLHGRLRRYRSLDAAEVAAAAVALLGEREPGIFTHEHQAIRALAARA